TCLAAGVVAPAAPGVSGGPTVVDGPRAGRSWLVGPLAVSAHHSLGLASLFAHQYRRDVSSHRQRAWGAAEDLGARAGHGLAGDGYRLQRPSPPAPLYPAGALGGGLQGSVVDPDRSAAGGQYGVLVWVAGLDRTGLQDHQARWLAVAAHPHDHARTGRTAVVGRRRGHPVA